MQAEIPGQEQDGYDTEPNFFHGMHQVRAIVYHLLFSLISVITAFSNYPATTSTAPWASQKTQARHDQNPSFSSPATTSICTRTRTRTSSYTCTAYHYTTSYRSYHDHSLARKPIHPATPSCGTTHCRCSFCTG
ncbi:hypothetical protein BDR05DRAFT_97688 [Suillus weaverae]|nr:hypothetical protein BDR05DRAFT_97688 [Suillus weaverae]